MTKLAIEVKGLRKTFGRQVVLDGIDLNVETGTVFALLGPNGAGKTTLINLLTTLVAPDAGIVKVAGHDVVKEKKEVKRSISLTGQFAAVDEVLTAEENLRMISRLSGLSAAESRSRAAELLRRFDLLDSAKKKVKTFSGGMRRRLDLAISLVADRPILFLDEPTTGLDTVSRRTLWDMILELKKQGITIFLTTQYLEEADQLADRIAVISGGRVVADGTPEELKARVGGEVLELRGTGDVVLESIPIDGSVRDVSRILSELSARYPADTRIAIRKPSMDDVFVALTVKPREEIA
jgi:daunorubicin resistance ABC transporter ATP-binding subunit